MGWNNALMLKAFYQKQAILEEKYRKAGMSEEAIRAIQDFDYQQYKSDRRFYMNTQALDTSDFDDEDDNDDSCSTLLVKFGDRLSTTIDEAEHSRFWWIEEITDPVLQKSIRVLPLTDLDILTKYVFEGYTQEALSNEFHLNQSTFSRKIEKISGFLKNAHKNRVLDVYQLRG